MQDHYLSHRSLPIGRPLKSQNQASSYFCGCGCGCAGVLAGAGAPFTFSMIEDGRFLVAKTVSEMEVSMKMIADQVVILESTVAVPRGPKAVWLPAPPKVAAIS